MKRVLLVVLISLAFSSSSLCAEDRQTFVDSVLDAKTANAISAELPRIQQEQAETTSQTKEQEMIALMEKSIANGRMVTDTLLEKLHPELKKHFRDYLMDGQVKYLEGLREGDPMKQAFAIETLMVWGKFWTENNAQILDELDVAKGPPLKPRFWGFVLKLLIADFVCILVYSFTLVALVIPLALVAKCVKNEITLKFFAIPFGVASWSYQLYFWGLWAAFLSALAIKYSGMPGVSHRWIYFVFAFMGCTGPIGLLARKSEHSSQSAKEYRSLQNQTMISGTFAVVAFIVFSIWPSLSVWPYGWALKSLV